MFHYIKKYTMLLIGWGVCSGLSAHRPDSTEWRRTDDIKYAHLWLSSGNAAGLSALPALRLTEIEGGITHARGGFVNYNESDNSIEMELSAESYYRVNQRVALYGCMEYSQFTGKNMAGSCLIDPETAPFNIVEFSDEHRGKKKYEEYRLAGAAAASITERFNIGARIDYTAANYAKMKDLRHRNDLLLLSASAGAVWRAGTSIDLGANYIYRRRVEGVFFDIYGKTDKSYYSLIDYGAFWGKKEFFGEEGYTCESEEKPLADTYHGGALQINWRISRKAEMLNEISLCSRNGYYGKKSPSTVVYSRHDGMTADYRGGLVMEDRRARHTINWGANYQTLDTRENIYRHDNEGGGLNTVNYYGSLKTSERSRFGMELGYTGQWFMRKDERGEDDMPALVTKAGITYARRKTCGYMYPYYRRQHLHLYGVNASGEYTVCRKADDITFLLGIRLNTGSGTPATDGAYSSAASGQEVPYDSSLYLMQEHEYLTASSIHSEAGVRYAWRIYGGTRMYAELHYGYSRAAEAEYLRGKDQYRCQVTLGCVF